MPDFEEDRRLAPKVFFIDPDPSIVSESFLEQAFFQGFETYSVADNIGGDLKRKVRVLTELYPDLLLFFTIDRKGSLKTWIDYLGELQGCHDNCVRIGVLYSRKTFSIDQMIKKTLNFDLGITAGCIALEGSIQKDQALLLQVLEANQAMGRRKVIRMKCGSSYRVVFVKNEQPQEGSLIDLSVSHFSMRFPLSAPDWDIGTRIKSVQLRLGGRILTVTAILAIKRMTQAIPVFVFLFHPEHARKGLDQAMKVKVNQIIFQHFQSMIHELLKKPEIPDQ